MFPSISLSTVVGPCLCSQLLGKLHTSDPWKSFPKISISKRHGTPGGLPIITGLGHHQMGRNKNIRLESLLKMMNKNLDTGHRTTDPALKAVIQLCVCGVGLVA